MDLYDEIAKVAYELWEQSGRIDGRELDNWLEAERIVLTSHTGRTTKMKKNIQKKPVSISSKGQKKSVEKKSQQKII
ncbi:MAG: DUF2934 domain-containing protein [Thermodesulfovibrionales bacterium]